MDTAEDNNDNFTTMCRACMMQINQSLAKKPLFSHRLFEIFTRCTNIKVDICDGLPAHVCLRCFQTLHLVQSFQKQCITSDVKLKELLKAAHPSLNDTYFDTKQVDVSGIKQEDDYTRNDNESTSAVLEPHQIFLVNTVTCKSELLEEDVEMGEVYKPVTNTGANVYVSKTSTKGEDGSNNSGDTGGNEQKSKRHLCIPCGRSYASLPHLKRHVKTHNKATRFMCVVCNKGYATLAYLMMHKKIHDNIRQFVCDLCGKSFALRSNLSYHKHTHKSGTSFACGDCDKVCKTSGTLKSHQARMHILEKKLVCHFCGKMFFTRSELGSHVRTHTKEKPQECSVCKKRFTANSTLIAHMRTHTGSRPYACDLCPKSFGQSRVLKNHRMTHTGEKPHVCVVCQRAFLQRIALKTHMKIHTKSPPVDNSSSST